MRTVLVMLAIMALGLPRTSEARAESEVEKAIATEIANNLKNSGRMHGYKIGIKMKGDTAWLVGQVSSDEQQQTAVEIAEQSVGTARVVSKLLVVEPGDPNPLRGPSNSATEPSPGSLPETAGGRVGQPVATSRGNRPVTYQRQIPAGRTPAGRPVAISAATGAWPAEAANQPAGYSCNSCRDQGMGYGGAMAGGGPMPAYGAGGGAGRARYDQAVMPGYAWPSYAAYPNYAALTYPTQYSPTAWPYIGPFYPYPQVPLGWRKVTLEWDDGWWFLDFKDRHCQR